MESNTIINTIQFCCVFAGLIYCALLYGSAFDTHPSQLFNNIKSTINASKNVIGFTSADTVKRKLVVIHVSEFPNAWFNNVDKTECLESISDIKLLRQIGALFIPVEETVAAERLYCADCRVLGGSTQEPSYWR